MKRLLLGLPLLLFAAPVRAEALTWKEFWEPFQESYNYGHSHGSPHWQDWHYDHHHPPYRRPRPRRCEVVITKKYWVPGHYLGRTNTWIPGYYEHRDVIEWERCGKRPL